MNRGVDVDSKWGRSLAKMDVLLWFNYLAFDIISDLAFGEPLGMVNKVRYPAPKRSRSHVTLLKVRSFIVKIRLIG